MEMIRGPVTANSTQLYCSRNDVRKMYPFSSFLYFLVLPFECVPRGIQRNASPRLLFF